MENKQRNIQAQAGNNHSLFAPTANACLCPAAEVVKKALPKSLEININDFEKGYTSMCGEMDFDYCAYPT